jgi:hypothetical protein
VPGIEPVVMSMHTTFVLIGRQQQTLLLQALEPRGGGRWKP